MLLLLILSLSIGTLNAIIYDCFSGKPATSRQLQVFKERNNTQYCLISAKPCDPNEWRRVDGSCNDFDNPIRGMVRTPTVKLLPTEFSPNYEPRKSKSGEDLPLPRYLRYQILKQGKTSDLHVTQLVPFYAQLAVNDVNTIHDVLNYVTNTTNCCQPEGRSNYICTPNKIPEDDAVHRYSGVRCQNLTRPQSFQYFGCADFGSTEFARIVFATPTFDLSTVYSNELGAINELRTFKDGLLKIEIDNGKIFPPGNPDLNPMSNKCVLNEPPRETRCNRYQANGVLSPVLLVIIFYRQHNYIAKKLAEMNPCWDDERLFFIARDINIAIYLQIYFYELLPVILGKKNMIKEGIISCSGGFRDMYKGKPPQVIDEFAYMHRWFHVVQEPDLNLYDKDGVFLKKFSLINATTRTGLLPLDDNINKIYQGIFRQFSGGFDRTVDHEISERVLGGAQYASDGTMNDLTKGRYLGFASYVKYREFCSKKPYKTFDSLEDVMTKERIFRLKEVYENVEDIELMAGVWAENHKPGSKLPHTMYCLLLEQYKLSLASDRHYYERLNRPYAFTFEQLKAIRKVTIAGVMCINADGVTEIQPKAFYKISPENPLTNCNSSKIAKIDLSPWKDPECDEEQDQ